MLNFEVSWPFQKVEKPKQLLIVRHGQTDLNNADVIQGWWDTHLNAKGVSQAEEIAKKLAKVKIDFIFSSDLKRAYQTSQIINSYHQLEIITTKLLRERDLGKLSGQHFHSSNLLLPRPLLEKDFHQVESWSQDFQMESQKQFMERVETFFTNLLPRFDIKDKTLLLVTHGGTIGAIFRLFQVTKPENWRPGNTELITFKIV